VPGLPGDDRVEGTAGAVPGLERGHLDLEPVPTGQVRHPRVGIDPEHPAAGRLELPGHDAGPAADVEDVGDVVTVLAPRGAGRDPVHQRVGVAGPGPVVAVGIQAERLGYLPGLMGFAAAKRRSGRR